MQKIIKTGISIIMFCIFFVYTICQYNKHITINKEYKNQENDMYYYDCDSIKRNDIGIFNDNNSNDILNAKNVLIKDRILKLVSDYNSGDNISFDGEYKKEIESILKNTKTVFIGDSNVKHFLYYDVLDEEYYIEFEGKSVNEEGDLVKEKLDDDISNVVIFNGYNLDTYNSAKEYIEAYNYLIKKIKEKLPNVKIYICSLLPATREVIYEDLETPLPHKIYNGKSFDIALENKDFKDAKYVDTKWMIRDNIHKEDGVHMKKEFYETFIPYLTYYVNLNNKDVSLTEDYNLAKSDKSLLENPTALWMKDNIKKVGTNDIYYYDCDEQWNMLMNKYGEDGLKVLEDAVCVGDSHFDRLLRPIISHLTAICKPRRTLRRLEQEINQAFSFDKKYLIIYTGNNDYSETTDLKEYEYEYRYIHDLSNLYKISDIFICSYMWNSQHGIAGDAYDEVIKNLCNEYDNFHYVDLRSVWDKKYVNDDRHLNFRFSFLGLDVLIKTMNEVLGHNISVNENIDMIAYNEKYLMQNDDIDISVLDTSKNDNEIIKFGKYKGNDIEWIFVKDANDGKVYMSKYLYINVPYNVKQESITWEDSSLRKYLNADFYNTSFSESEKEKIVSSVVKNIGNEITGQKGCKYTKDYIYIPAIEELEELVKKLDNDEMSKKLAAKTYNFKDNKSMYINSNKDKWYYGNSPYWLRNPGLYDDDAAFVNFNGTIVRNGVKVSYNQNGVRLMVKIKGN